MAEEFFHNIVYREKGEKRYIRVKIDFISNYVNREIDKLLEMVNDVQLKNDELTLLQIELKTKTDEPEQIRITSKMREIVDSLKNINLNEFIDTQYSIIQAILEDNNITDEKLLMRKFWDRQVDPAAINDFLIQCRYKDVKKKAVRET